MLVAVSHGLCWLTTCLPVVVISPFSALSLHCISRAGSLCRSGASILRRLPLGIVPQPVLTSVLESEVEGEVHSLYGSRNANRTAVGTRLVPRWPLKHTSCALEAIDIVCRRRSTRIVARPFWPERGPAGRVPRQKVVAPIESTPTTAMSSATSSVSALR